VFGEGKAILARPRCRSEDNIKLILKIGFQGLKRIYISLNKDYNPVFYNLIS
jgi:hypothetical protein